jgi:hypothetical protein
MARLDSQWKQRLIGLNQLSIMPSDVIGLMAEYLTLRKSLIVLIAYDG